MNLNYPHSALIIVDLQYDFCPGGALAVAEGDQVVAPVNRLSAIFAASGGTVVASQDWHPPEHCSFTEWPSHCVQGSRGAELHQDLDLRPVNLVIRKGFRKELDSYSAFFENDRKTSTGLDGFLKSLSIDTLVFGGLATDYCVFYSAMDAANLGYRCILAADACRGIAAESIEKALKQLGQAGVTITDSGEIK
ncbi:MAG: nicotinamidase [Treponema sp.]|nr:nicotinamidase [Treponema sp.]